MNPKMNLATTPDDVERFAALVGQQLGVQVDRSGYGILGEVLARRVAASGGSIAGYLERLAGRDFPRLELQRLAVEITIGETYFFRNRDQFQALVQVAVPACAADPSFSTPLRILSAGCATGDEAYSIAIALREAYPLGDPPLIHAIDVNPNVLDRARRGHYSNWSLRELTESQRRHWFRNEGNGFQLDPAIRRAVVFEERNLADNDAEFWLSSRFDIVFCRNVLMYFGPEQARAAVARIARALAPGGFLFLGHAESLRGLSEDFQLCHVGDAFFYRRSGGAPARETPAIVARPFKGSGWVDDIRLASERIRELARQAPPAVTSTLPTTMSVAADEPDLALAMESLRSERFGDVLDHLDALSPAHAADPGALLLKAVSQVHRGELAAAEATCRRLLAREQFDAGAHYVLALCREGSNDAAGALEHARVAAYLDPAFAMPRLHLGLLARRRGDRDGARRELAQALPLLQREDASRLLLFGGGFERDALVELCRTEIEACGG